MPSDKIDLVFEEIIIGRSNSPHLSSVTHNDQETLFIIFIFLKLN